jgi:hypothetical protein
VKPPPAIDVAALVSRDDTTTEGLIDDWLSRTAPKEMLIGGRATEHVWLAAEPAPPAPPAAEKPEPIAEDQTPRSVHVFGVGKPNHWVPNIHAFAQLQRWASEQIGELRERIAALEKQNMAVAAQGPQPSPLLVGDPALTAGQSETPRGSTPRAATISDLPLSDLPRLYPEVAALVDCARLLLLVAETEDCGLPSWATKARAALAPFEVKS